MVKKPAKAMVLVGTRPEAIKMAPVIRALRSSRFFEPLTCATGQHRDLLDQALGLFDVKPDFDLDLMRPNQDLTDVTTRCLEGMRGILRSEAPDVVLVQGDTATAFSCALASFYARIPVGHVEAGLRTWNRYSPFPEEIYRRMLTELAEFHFAPTSLAAANLKREAIAEESVVVTGNTGIDALLWMAERASRPRDLPAGVENKKLILLTAHRRENFGEPLREIFDAVKQFATSHPEFHIVYPVHPNPNVTGPAQEMLSKLTNVSLIPPVEYGELVYLLKHCHLVLTDSGGIQEEAPSFGKPILVLRDTTERPEAVEAGCAVLVGPVRENILRFLENLLSTDSETYRKMATRNNPFGDGSAAQRIVRVLDDWFETRAPGRNK